MPALYRSLSAPGRTESMKLLINTTEVSFNPFSAVSAEGYPITPLLVYACIPRVAMR
jgi:hypothetical protein